MHGKSEVP